MQASQIEIVPFSPDHLDAAVALSRQAGWPHRVEDWQMARSSAHPVGSCWKAARLHGRPQQVAANMALEGKDEILSQVLPTIRSLEL